MRALLERWERREPGRCPKRRYVGLGIVFLNGFQCEGKARKREPQVAGIDELAEADGFCRSVRGRSKMQ
jgi:hypothetical protein